MRKSVVLLALAAGFAWLGLVACSGQAAPAAGKIGSRSWALAIHGGAGTIPRDLDPSRRQAYIDGMTRALQAGRDVLDSGGEALDAVEKVILTLEDNPLFNAGKGAVFTHDGKHELDAAIMSGQGLECGAVAALRTVKHPIRLARLVMERTPHVFLVGEGAEEFATEMGVERVAPEFFDTPRRRRQWEKLLEREESREAGASSPAKEKGTVGAVALDLHGHLAAGTSTGGLTGKRFGRVGDVPVIGAGTYADDRTCAVSCTGTGEEFIRHGAAYTVSDLMAYRQLPVIEAAKRVIHEILLPGDGGLIAVSRDGEIAMEYSSEGMFRGAADGAGRFEVKIWE